MTGVQTCALPISLSCPMIKIGCHNWAKKTGFGFLEAISGLFFCIFLRFFWGCQKNTAKRGVFEQKQYFSKYFWKNFQYIPSRTIKQKRGYCLTQSRYFLPNIKLVFFYRFVIYSIFFYIYIGRAGGLQHNTTKKLYLGGGGEKPNKTDIKKG